MSPRHTLGARSGNSALRQTRSSIRDDFRQPGTRKSSMRKKRRSLKLQKLVKSTSRRIQSTNSESDGINADIDGDTDESDDNKDRSFAPSDASRRSGLRNLKSTKKNALLMKRQAGPPLTSSPHNTRSTNGPRSIMSSHRRKSSERVRFDLEKVQTFPSAPAYQDNQRSGVEDESDSVYQNLGFISESDADEDDPAIEAQETKYLIQHMTETGQLPDTFGETYEILHSSRSRYGSDNEELSYSDYILPSTEVELEHVRQEDYFMSPPIMNADLIMSPVNMTIPTPNLMSPIGLGLDFKSDPPFETGFRTPSSNPRSVHLLDVDGDDTEPENMAHKSVTSARLSRSAQRQLPPLVSPAGIRKKNKPITPRLGSFKIDKTKHIISHDDSGELIVKQQGKKVGGTITPNGVVTSSSHRHKPIPLNFPADAVTAPPSVLASPICEYSPILSRSYSQPTLMPSSLPNFAFDFYQSDVDFKEFIIRGDPQDPMESNDPQDSQSLPYSQ